MSEILLLFVINLIPASIGIQYAAVIRRKGKNGPLVTDEVRKQGGISLPPKLRACFLFAGWLVLWMLINVGYFAFRQGNETVRAAALIFIAGALVAETLAAAVLEMVRRQDEEINTRLLGTQAAYYERQYRTIAAYQEAARRQRHEQKHERMMLIGMVKKRQWEELLSYLEQEQKRQEENTPAVRTGNFTVDAVMNYEENEARKREIQLETEISVPEEMDVSGRILCGLLGNAIDNAMEASEKLPVECRRVCIWMKVEKRNLMLEVKNRFDGTVETRHGHLLSSKPDAAEHGIGLRVMEELLRQADGTMETAWDESWFTLRMILYHVI